MTVENIKKLRALAMKANYPIKVICDNEHIFIDNSDDTFTIVWDDETETLTQLQPSAVAADFYTQSKLPFRLVTTEYEHIQSIEILVDRQVAINTLSESKENNKITTDQYEKDFKLLSIASAVCTIPNTH